MTTYVLRDAADLKVGDRYNNGGADKECLRLTPGVHRTGERALVVDYVLFDDTKGRELLRAGQKVSVREEGE